MGCQWVSGRADLAELAVEACFNPAASRRTISCRWVGDLKPKAQGDASDGEWQPRGGHGARRPGFEIRDDSESEEEPAATGWAEVEDAKLRYYAALYDDEDDETRWSIVAQLMPRAIKGAPGEVSVAATKARNATEVRRRAAVLQLAETMAQGANEPAKDAS